MQTRIYTYGMLPPTSGNDDLEKMLKAGHNYYNALLEIERDKQAKLEMFWAHRGGYVETLRGLQQLEASTRKLDKEDPERETAWATVKVLRKDVGELRQRAIKAAIPPEDSRRIERRKELVKEAKDVNRVLTAKQLTDLLDAEPDCVSPRRALQIKFAAEAEERGVGVSGKKLNQALREASLVRVTQEIEDEAARQQVRARNYYGVHWGTYLLVHDAVEQALKTAETFPRFKRWTGFGRVGVPIMTGKGINPDAVYSDVAGGTCPLRIQAVPSEAYALTRGERKRATRTVVRVVVNTTGRNGNKCWVTFPATLHRPIPPDARIVGAWIKISPFGLRSKRYQLQLQIQSASFDTSTRKSGSGTTAVNFGWRASGRVMVALHSSGKFTEFKISPQIAEKINRADEVRSKRDLAANAIRSALFSWLGECGVPPIFEKVVDPVLRHHWSGQEERDTTFQPPTTHERIKLLKLTHETNLPTRLHTLHEIWDPHHLAKDTRPEDQIIFGHLREWAIEDKNLYREEVGLRRHAALGRKQQLTLWANAICDETAHVLVENTNYAKMKIKATEKEKVPVEVHVAMNRLEDICAPGETRSTLEEVCKKRGVKVTRVDPKDLTLIHHRCGFKHAERARPIRRTCENPDCSGTFDQDYNFCVGLFERSGDPTKPSFARNDAIARNDTAAE